MRLAYLNIVQLSERCSGDGLCRRDHLGLTGETLVLFTGDHWGHFGLSSKVSSDVAGYTLMETKKLL